MMRCNLREVVTMYQPLKVPRNQFVAIRTLKYHVLLWGEPAPGRTPLVLVHGWMDVAAKPGVHRDRDEGR